MTYDRARAHPADNASMRDPRPRQPRQPRSAPAAVGRAPAEVSSGRRAGGGLFAAQLGDSRLRKAGFALAAAGLLMVICSFLTWTSASDDGLSIAVTGMGSVSLEVSDERAETMGGAAQAVADLDERSKSPGLVTVVLGALLVVSGAMLVVNIFPGIGALTGGLLALIAVFMSLEYLFAPGSAVLDGTGDAGIGFAGAGLWLVTLGACVAVAASCSAAVVAMRSTRPTVANKTSPPADRPARRPSQGHRPPPRTPNPHTPNPRTSHYNPAPLPPIRRSAASARPDRGMPPSRRDGPPPAHPGGTHSRGPWT